MELIENLLQLLVTFIGALLPNHRIQLRLLYPDESG